MTLNLSQFESGIKEAMTSMADFGHTNGALFPTLATQHKWQAVHQGNALHLCDGTSVYSFRMPHGLSTKEDFPLTRLPDINKFEFDKLPGKKRAQVHRSDPGSLYFTLQEGTQNPTLTLKHIAGNEWKGIPKAKKPTIKKASPGLLSAIPDTAAQLLLAPGKHVPLNMGLAAASGLLYHLGKRKFYNTPEENEEEDQEGLRPLLRRVLFPTAATGLYGLAANSMFGDSIARWKRLGQFPGITNSIVDHQRLLTERAQANVAMKALEMNERQQQQAQPALPKNDIPKW